MNLVSLYESLVIPDNDNRKVFGAVRIPGFINFRVAIDCNGNPVLLLSAKNCVKSGLIKNFKLKYLQILQNAECKVFEDNEQRIEVFTVIAFTGEDVHLRKQFLRISESLFQSLGIEPSQEEIMETVDRYVEIFRHLSEPPTKTVYGLWTELFLIVSSSDPRTLLRYWHEAPEEKFDFNAGLEKIEVKSNSQFERVHFFNSEQLNPPQEARVLVASIFIKQQSSGVNIQELVERIAYKIGNDADLILKLNIIVFRTLGGSLDQSIKIKFDYAIAQESLKFYRHQDILKIEKMNIPNEVTEVRYKSNLSDLIPIRPSGNEAGGLFNAI
jgi:Putative  PD-(D/E)XK family member, (DUF4420)